MKTLKYLATLAASLVLACVLVLPQANHIAPDWGDPHDSFLPLAQCNWEHEYWRIFPVPMDSHWHAQGSGVDCRGGYYPQYCRVTWISSVWDHYYIWPYQRDCQSEVQTYAGYGTPQVSAIWCPDHETATPAIDYHQPNPAAAYWENDEARGEHWYVRAGVSTLTTGTNYYYYGQSSYQIRVRCFQNDTNTHTITMQGPNNWRVYGPSCM